MRSDKASTYWKSVIDSERSAPAKLWRTINNILGRSRVTCSGGITADEFQKFFNEKVANIRMTTDNSAPPVYSSLQANGAQFSDFNQVTVDEVINSIRHLPDKFSAADPIPTSLLKQFADVFAPFLTVLFNRSLAAGHVPRRFKDAFLTPIGKKPGLDPTNTSSFRPISNLSVLSKLLERLVASQMVCYLKQFDLLPPLQSGFREGHSTETAILKVLTDLRMAIDRGDFGILVLLDLSAAFDTVDHNILLQRLEKTFGIGTTVLRWFQSYLHERHQHVRCGGEQSSISVVSCGVPQGSVLGPLLFILYTADLCGIIERHGFQSHLYADDTQIYNSCRPRDVNQLTDRLVVCLDDVFNWMRSNRLQPNPDKTEILWCSSSKRVHSLPIDPIRCGGAFVIPTRSARNLGVYFDSALSMRDHVSRTVSRCFGALRQLRSVRQQIPLPVFQSLVTPLILSRLDYGNVALIGSSQDQLRRLQAVQNSAARLVFNLRRRDHISDALLSLHWLKVRERIDHKLLTMTYRVLHGSAPTYLDVFHRVANHAGRQRLRSAQSNKLLVPRTKLVTTGQRSFPVAGAKAWNCLPRDIASIESLFVFRKRLKTHLFCCSYPDIIYP